MKTLLKIITLTVHFLLTIYRDLYLADWYFESRGRNNVYADHIVTMTGGKNNIPNWEEVRRRSPVFMKTPVKQRNNTILNLYVGIHDGYIGSVPVTQTFEVYNKYYRIKSKSGYMIDQKMYTLLKRRVWRDDMIEYKAFMGRDIIFKKTKFEKVKLIVFEEGHEMSEYNILDDILR